MSNIKNLFAPSSKDRKYTQTEQLKISLIMRMDSYKFSHPFAYPKSKKITGMSSYGTARIYDNTVIVPAGMQLLCKRYLTQRITMADVDAAEAFAIAHFGRPLFFRSGWEKVVKEYDGALPLIIRAVPEGMLLRGGMPIYTVTCLDVDVWWMSAAFETMIQRGVWYPTTIATQDRETYQATKHYYEITGADMGLLPFSLHDFGGRGVTCAEQAEIGGAYHLFAGYMGSDTIEGILTANFYYNDPMAAFSVYATEHAIECSFGPTRENAIEYLTTQLDNAIALGIKIVSIVIDGYDVYRETELLCTGELRDKIIEMSKMGVKVVFRPDSGDMMEVVPRILRMQAMAFGTKTTSKGYKQINCVGVLQGDGVDKNAVTSLLGYVTAVMGLAADVVVFGSGGALLQKCNRDTLKFAQKASAILVDDEWVGIAKDPVTDSGKKSREGVLTLTRSKMTGELMTMRLDQGPLDEDFEDMMQLVYHTGDLYNETSLAEVRGRTA